MRKIVLFVAMSVLIGCGAGKSKGDQSSNHSVVVISHSVQVTQSTHDYSGYSVKELKDKKKSLELALNYAEVNHYLGLIERGDVSHMALTKIDRATTQKYMENEPSLAPYYSQWKTSSAAVGDFEKKHAPELKELSSQLKRGEIDKDHYYKRNREVRAALVKDYPATYPQISEDHVSSLKTLWKKTGRFMVEDYKKKETAFPTYWIPIKNREAFKKTSEYNIIDKELQGVAYELL